MYRKAFSTLVILYTDVNEWKEKAKKLADMYRENFKQYCDNDAAKALVVFGPQL